MVVARYGNSRRDYDYGEDYITRYATRLQQKREKEYEERNTGLPAKIVH